MSFLILLAPVVCCGGFWYTDGDDSSPDPVLLMFFGPLVVIAVRVLFVAVIATPEHLILREVFYTRTLTWNRVGSATLDSISTSTGSSWTPRLSYRRRDGRTRRMFVAALGDLNRSHAQRNVDKLNDLIHDRRRKRS